jgi:transcription termination/antitermination protein NusG
LTSDPEIREKPDEDEPRDQAAGESLPDDPQAVEQPIAPPPAGDKTQPDKTQPDETQPDETQPDETQPDETQIAPVTAPESEPVEPSSGEVLPVDSSTAEEEPEAKQWFIVKVQVNREESIRRALERRIKMHGLDAHFGEIVVPTEDVAEYNKSGKRRIVKRKLYPGYIMLNMVLNDDTWFLVRETPGIGDFTGSAGKPTPMADHEVQRIIVATRGVEEGESPVKTSIPFKSGDRVRVKEGYFENFEGDVDSIDQANGRVTVMINIFGRSTPVELEHWQIESV